MTKDTYSLIESYMLSCMTDSAHDKEHIYRVLYTALEIAKAENDVDCDVLIAACLLHDIGRKAQFENPDLCHAAVGGDQAFRFLVKNGFETEYSEKVKHCIQTHRFRKNNLPQSIEAKILFDADKLDVSGAIGIARTLMYKGTVSEPLYSVLPDGTVSDGTEDPLPSFLQEYKHKLEKLYQNFYTEKAKQMAAKRQESAVAFYNSLYEEIHASRSVGNAELNKIIT